MPLLLISTLRFTYGDKKIQSNILKSQSVIIMIVVRLLDGQKI